MRLWWWWWWYRDTWRQYQTIYNEYTKAIICDRILYIWKWLCQNEFISIIFIDFAWISNSKSEIFLWRSLFAITLGTNFFFQTALYFDDPNKIKRKSTIKLRYTVSSAIIIFFLFYLSGFKNERKKK